MTPKVLVSEIGHAEGPSVLADGRCVFCECYDGKIGVWSPNGERGVYAEVGGGPNATVLGAAGELYVANNGGAVGPYRTSDFTGGFLQRVDPDGTVTKIATEVGGHRLNMPNDLVFGPDGRLYFTDPGRWAPDDGPDGQDDGAIYVLGPDGQGERLVEVGKTYPNGIVAEADGSIVWVETYSRRVRRRRTDGSVEEVYRFPDQKHLPDGLAVAENGDLVVATLSSGGVHRVAADGKKAEWIDCGGTTLSNIVFSGRDVYVTDLGSKPAATSAQVYYGRLLRLDLGIAGMVMFRGSITPT